MTKRGNWGTWAVIEYEGRIKDDSIDYEGGGTHVTKSHTAKEISQKVNKQKTIIRPHRKKKKERTDFDNLLVIRTSERLFSSRCLFWKENICQRIGARQCRKEEKCRCYRPKSITNAKCHYNFGIDHNKCQLYGYCDKNKLCMDFIRKGE